MGPKEHGDEGKKAANEHRQGEEEEDDGAAGSFPHVIPEGHTVLIPLEEEEENDGNRAAWRSVVASGGEGERRRDEGN